MSFVCAGEDIGNRVELRRLGGLRVVVGLLATRDDEMQERAVLLFGNCMTKFIVALLENRQNC